MLMPVFMPTVNVMQHYQCVGNVVQVWHIEN